LSKRVNNKKGKLNSKWMRSRRAMRSLAMSSQRTARGMELLPKKLRPG